MSRRGRRLEGGVSLKSKREQKPRARPAVLGGAAAITATGLVFAAAPQAPAQPTPSPPAPHRVDQLGDFTYAQLFAVGVQVYERVETRRSTVYTPAATTLYTPILERLHSPRDGRRGTLRYGFIGSQLPAAFATQGTLHRPSPRLGSGRVSKLDPKTLEPSGQIVSICVNDVTNGRPIGPLAGGSLALWCPA